jgi:hypothetical protein
MKQRKLLIRHSLNPNNLIISAIRNHKIPNIPDRILVELPTHRHDWHKKAIYLSRKQAKLIVNNRPLKIEEILPNPV